MYIISIQINYKGVIDMRLIKQVNTRLSHDDSMFLKMMAMDRGTTQSTIIREILKAKIKEWKREQLKSLKDGD